MNPLKVSPRKLIWAGVVGVGSIILSTFTPAGTSCKRCLICELSFPDSIQQLIQVTWPVGMWRMVGWARQYCAGHPPHAEGGNSLKLFLFGSVTKFIKKTCDKKYITVWSCPTTEPNSSFGGASLYSFIQETQAPLYLNIKFLSAAQMLGVKQFHVAKELLSHFRP